MSSHSSTPPHRESSPARKVLANMLTNWQRARTRAALESLSDDLLKDIGISRSEIPYVAHRVTARPGTPAPAVRRESRLTVREQEATA